MTATKDMVFQYPYSIEYANDYKGGYDNFAYFAMYEEDVMSKKDGQVNYASDDARYTRRIDAVKFLLRTEHEAQVVPAEVVEALAGWFNSLHLLFESKKESVQEPAIEEPAQNECEHCTCEEQTADMNQLAQATSQAYQQYCEAFYSLTATNEEIEACWQAYKELYDQSKEKPMITAIIATNAHITIGQLVKLEILPNSKRVMENRYRVNFYTDAEWVRGYLDRQVAKGRIASFKMEV